MVESRRIDSITQGYCKEKSSGIMTRYQLLKSHGIMGEHTKKTERKAVKLREMIRELEKEKAIVHGRLYY